MRAVCDFINYTWKYKLKLASLTIASSKCVMVNLAQKWKSKMERGTYLACWTIHLKINTQYLMPDWWWTWNKMETLVVLVLSASLTHTELLMISYSTTSSSSLPFCKMPELIDGELVWRNGVKTNLWLLREFIWARDQIVKFLAPVKDLFQCLGNDLLCLVELVLYWMKRFG